MLSGSVPPPVTEGGVLDSADARLPVARTACGAMPTLSAGAVGCKAQTAGAVVGCAVGEAGRLVTVGGIGEALGAVGLVGVAEASAECVAVDGVPGVLVGVAAGGIGVLDGATLDGFVLFPLSGTTCGLSVALS
jgi:hypothetical protein